MEERNVFRLKITASVLGALFEGTAFLLGMAVHPGNNALYGAFMVFFIPGVFGVADLGKKHRTALDNKYLRVVLFFTFVGCATVFVFYNIGFYSFELIFPPVAK